MASTDDVQLPDLQVIQRYSLAVRGASAPREDVIAALQADLAWLSGGARPKPAAAAKAAPVKAAPVKAAPVKAAPVKKAAAKKAPATKKKAGARRA